MERNSELFSLLRNGSDRNSESLLHFLFHGSEFCAFFSSAEWFGTEVRELLLFLFHCTKFRAFFSLERNFESFLFRGTAGIPPEHPEFRRNSWNYAGIPLEQTNFSVYSSGEKFFVSEIANPTCKLVSYITMKLSQVSVPALLYINSSFSKMCM
jgi:hypothetical protein